MWVEKWEDFYVQGQVVDPEKWAGILVDSRQITGDATIETLRFHDENDYECEIWLKVYSTCSQRKK